MRLPIWRTYLALIFGIVYLTALVLSGGAIGQTPGSMQSAATPALGAESPWPLRIQSGDATLTLYQPQLDSWDGYTLEARIALRVDVGKDKPQVHYAALHVSARTLTDKGRRTVRIDEAKITRAEFPSVDAAQAKAWTDAIAQDFANNGRTVSLDRMEALLAVIHAEQPAGRTPLHHSAPQIIFSTVPAILISIDGLPVYRSVQGTSLDRVINTRPLLLRDKSGRLSVKVFDGWMSAPAISGPWVVLTRPSAELTSVLKQTSSAHLIDPLSGQSSPDEAAPKLANTPPAIFVATSPTELIVMKGAPQYEPIAGTGLRYVSNTTGNVFRDGNDYYVLVAGRWFRAQSEAGPWTYVAANALPADFAKIPEDSPKENVKASVAGTEQAREAAIAASIPQVAAVKIAGTTLPAPHFDGEPVLKTIEGTSLAYVTNTPTPIIKVTSSTFFAVSNGVWFVAPSVHGPWSVASSVPAAIYSIPPSSPLYYVTFVRVYNATATTVYVGYTPGYQGTIVDPNTGVVVYGTGYVYDPWVGTVWYGTPVTYGYAADVTYTPWTGWAVAFGIGWAWGAATTAWGWGWGAYPYWGPWAYPAWSGAAWGPRGGAVAWGPGGWAGYTGNIYSQWGNRASVARAAGGYDAWTGNQWAGRAGASYNSRTGVASAGQRGAVGNVYTGNYAAGQRGIAEGNNRVVVGHQGTAGNAYTGREISGGGGAVYNKNTGQVTTFGHTTGENGATVGHIGDDVYAGKDGNVYRNNGDGWQKASRGGGWSSAPGNAQGQATRNATGGLGSTQASGGAESSRSLDQQRSARQLGDMRSQRLQGSSLGMQRSFGGRGGGFRRR
jgi:hypothetical protein